MKIFQHSLLAFAIFTTAFQATAFARTRVYLQFSPLYAIPANDLEIHSGMALSLGAAVAERHELELEGSTVTTEYKPNNTTWHTEESDIRFRHLLATYRFNVFTGKSHRLFAGLSVGAARVSYEIKTVSRFLTSAIIVNSGSDQITTTSVGYLSTSIYNTSLRTSNPPTYSIYNPYVSTYNSADGTLTNRYSGSNTVATGGPQIGFSYEVAPNSTLSLSVKCLYTGETDVTQAGWTTFVQSGIRYTF